MQSPPEYWWLSVTVRPCYKTQGTPVNLSSGHCHYGQAANSSTRLTADHTCLSSIRFPFARASYRCSFLPLKPGMTNLKWSAQVVMTSTVDCTSPFESQAPQSIYSWINLDHINGTAPSAYRDSWQNAVCNYTVQSPEAVVLFL